MARRVAVGQRPADVEDRSARARAIVNVQGTGVVQKGGDRIRCPRNSKESKKNESVIEFTVPIESVATGAPVAITTSGVHARYPGRAPVVSIAPIRMAQSDLGVDFSQHA